MSSSGASDPGSVDPEPPLARAGQELGDFTASRRTILIAGMAVGIGALAAFVAVGLLDLIAFFTNLFFFQKWSIAPASPSDHTLGLGVILIPVAGALLIGLMARYGSERIRGHGIPEAIEAILMRGSRVEPRVALLKPLSAAISIGSGGPFGAEGPIIMTGGAFGSMIAQLFHLTSAERKTLLVSGAAAGMSATFAAPVAAAVLAVELLLFELKPRSFVPVALASASAALLRYYLLGPGPLFAVPPHAEFVGVAGLAGCALLGLLVGAVSALMTKTVYAAEDFFARLPIHWMWWPMLGALVIGIGGWIEPRALGVGYANIEALLQDSLTLRSVLVLLVVKWTIWAVSLGSGTSGGVLAPLLMIGSAVGALAAPLLPYEGAGFWPLVAMGAILGGMMRAPFTAVFFTLELSNDRTMLLPLLVAGCVAHGFTVLTMRRSILTEKVARRGFHVSREYSIDPLEVLFVREVMDSAVAALPSQSWRSDVLDILESELGRAQALFPIVDDRERMIGVASRDELERWVKAGGTEQSLGQSNVGSATPIVAHADEPLRAVAYRMAELGKIRLPVVDRQDPRRLLGIVTLRQLLKARLRHLEEEQRRERVLPLHLLLPAFARRRR